MQTDMGAGILSQCVVGMFSTHCQKKPTVKQLARCDDLHLRFAGTRFRVTALATMGRSGRDSLHR